MSENITPSQLLHRARLVITEGQEEEALAALAKVQPEDEPQKYELAYLRAWCHTLRGRWDEAAHILLASGATGDKIDDIQSLGQTERRRRAYDLLLLGDIASNLGRYEEATRHYTQCIRCLDERRMNVISVRIKARLGLGVAYTQTGLYTVAQNHLEDALKLCGGDSRHANLPDIYYGLCDVHRRLGGFERAFEYGQKALQLYVDRSDKALEGRMRNMLGRICFQMRDFQNASNYLTEALALATSVNNLVMILVNLTALADVRCEEGLLPEARRYCEYALDYLDRIPEGRSHFIGMLYIVCGKVSEKEAEQATGLQAREYLEKAVDWYKKAEEILSPIQSIVELADVYRRLAHILEVSGKQDQAIVYWRSAYTLHSGPEESRLS
jgi:tetratricopeptide (TPR) repeat protein